MERKYGCAGCLTIVAILVLIGLLNRSSDKPTTSPVPAPAPVSPHDQRLAELRSRRESLAVSTAIEIELGKQLARDAMKLSMEPFPDPGERQFLIHKMDEQHRRAAESLEQLEHVNAEIAKEEGQQPPQPTERPTDSAQPATVQPPEGTAPPDPPAVPAGSGVLCNGPVQVPRGGELTFRNLPGDQLKFAFDHDAWSPLIHREPNGTQTLVMRSIKPGIQTNCDIRWEIAQ